MTVTSGGELKIKYHADNGTMVEIKGISASFEYEDEPELYLVNYLVTKFIAPNAKNGEIAGWELGRD